MEKLLILGSDLGTYEIVQEAQKMGLYVIVADYLETSPTKKIADERWLISTTNLEELSQHCIKAGISGVTYGANDMNATCARKLCMKLGLPYLCKSDFGWEISQNKFEFKKVCKKVGLPVATDYRIDDNLNDYDLDAIQYPVVVKPVDSSGNRGMSYCNNEAEVRQAVKKVREYSSNPNIICERQLNGPEWVVNYLLENGEVRLLYVGRELHQHGYAANNYSMIMTTNNGLKLWQKEMDDKVRKFFKEAEFGNGIAWFETIKDRDGHFYVLEPAYRFSSETIYSIYEKVSGFNSTRWYIECALGIEHKPEELPDNLNIAYKSCVGAYHLFACHGGKIHKIEGLDELLMMKNVVVDLPKRENNIVVDKVCMGVIKIYGETVEILIETLKKINSVFYILNENGENMFIRFTEYEEMVQDFNLGLIDFE